MSNTTECMSKKSRNIIFSESQKHRPLTPRVCAAPRRPTSPTRPRARDHGPVGLMSWPRAYIKCHQNRIFLFRCREARAVPLPSDCLASSVGNEHCSECWVFGTSERLFGYLLPSTRYLNICSESLNACSEYLNTKHDQI